METQPYRWGLVGAGWMARAMADDIALSKRVQLAGVYSRSEASTRAFSKEYGARPYSSLEALLADPEIDVINITTPNQLHFEQTQQALEAGKHVLLEKPFTLNTAQAERLVQLAHKEKRFLMEAMWVRFLPIQKSLNKVLSDPKNGKLRLVQASFHGKPPREPDNRFFNPALGGGSLMDLGVYSLSFVLSLFGQDAHKITSSAVMAASGVDESMAAILEFSNGAQAQISAGFDGNFRHAIRIHTTQVSIEIPLTNGWQQRELHLYRNGELEKTIEKPLKGRGYFHEVEAVVDCLDRGQTQNELLPLEHTLRVMRHMDALRAQWGLVFPGE